MELDVLLAELAAWADEREPGLETLTYGGDPDQVVDVRRGGERAAILLHGGFWRPAYTRETTRALAVDLVDGVASVAGKVECGYIFVDGSSVGDITESDLKDRRILGEEGFLSVIVVVDSVTGKVVSGPEIHARGFAEEETTFADVRQPIIDAINASIAEGTSDPYELQQTVRRVVGRWVNRAHRRRPMIIPVVIEA